MLKEKPRFVTFTGIDEKVDLKRCSDLSKRYPIEWGILVGGKEGSNRYPKARVIEEFLSRLLPSSLHLCKYNAMEFNKGVGGSDWSVWARRVDRIQVNLAVDGYDPVMLDYMSHYYSKPVVVQCREEKFPIPRGMLQYLFDRSGGRGIFPDRWPDQDPAYQSHIVGYAGGINPSNVKEVVGKVNAHRYWLDMETGVRNEYDWMDLDLVEAVCKEIYGEYGHD